MNRLKKNRTGAYIILIIALLGLSYSSIIKNEINTTPLFLASLAFTIGILLYLNHLNKEAKKLKADREARKVK